MWLKPLKMQQLIWVVKIQIEGHCVYMLKFVYCFPLFAADSINDEAQFFRSLLFMYEMQLIVNCPDEGLGSSIVSMFLFPSWISAVSLYNREMILEYPLIWLITQNNNTVCDYFVSSYQSCIIPSDMVDGYVYLLWNCVSTCWHKGLS